MSTGAAFRVRVECPLDGRNGERGGRREPCLSVLPHGLNSRRRLGSQERRGHRSLIRELV